MNKMLHVALACTIGCTTFAAGVSALGGTAWEISAACAACAIAGAATIVLLDRKG